MREQARQNGLNSNYDRRWRDADPAEAPSDIAPCVRIKAPLEGEIVIHDRVQGEIRIEAANLDDFVILRSDGTPTYMLSAVVDDHDMGVSHVIRGDDHLNNASRQAIIYKAMGWDLPDFAHIPLILASDGAKMSKRHGAVSVTAYRDMGYLPEAMCNYLLRLGWGHGDREIIPREEAIELFDIDDVSKGAARFDFEKLDSINAHYLREADHTRLAGLVCAIFEKRGLQHDEVVQNRLIAHMEELTSRSKTLCQVAEDSEFYAKEPPLDFDDGAAQKLSSDEALAVLKRLRQELEQLETFESDAIQGLCKQIAGELTDGKMGRVGMPLRAALTGTTSSPSIFTAAAVLGRQACLQRIDYALNKYDNGFHQQQAQ
jgi:glutamyl-tRNA synthetase